MAEDWYRERLPAQQHSLQAPELVLLHGWGMSSAVWRGWLPVLRRRCNVTLLDLPGFGRSPAQPDVSLDHLLEQLAQRIPTGAVLLGWSLGGMLALALAARYPHRCAAVATIACNPTFVQRPDWPGAMPVATFADFCADVERAPAPALRRFCSLQARGDEQERALLKTLRELPQTTDPAALRWGLELLRSLDLREALANLRLPAMHLYGAADALVPAGAVAAVAALVPHHWVSLLDQVSHLPFLSQPELCNQHLERLLMEARLLPRRQTIQRAKVAVARSFTRAAPSYDGAADLQRQVAAHLLELAQLPGEGSVLDIGCGTGAITAQLAERQANGSVVALDLADGMVAYGRERHGASNVHWLCGDAENLPLAGASVDAAFSSLALQWCENLGAAYAELERVLRPGGSAWIATLGPDTLHELRAAWSEADRGTHVNRFAGRDEIAAAAARAGLRLAQHREQQLTLEYAELGQLTRELKALGAHNVNADRPAGLGGRQRLQRFRDAYERRRNAAGRLPASYQVWYLQLEKAAAEDRHG